MTIAGEPLPHLLFEFVLSYSHWTWVAVAFGETFEALDAGLQGALWALGAVPAVLRSDNLSAATHELKAEQWAGSHARGFARSSITTGCARAGSRQAARMKMAWPSKPIAA